jgi:hypothetical protein
MPSTYSSLKFELIGTGEQAGNWGNTTNTNFGTAVEQAITGLGNPVFTADTNLTITLTDTIALQTARALVLSVTSTVSLTTTRQLIVPAIQKQYIVHNSTTGGQSITVITGVGTGITVPNGSKAHLYVDGVDVIDAVSRLSSLTLASPLPVTSGGTGTATPGLVAGTNITVSGDFPAQTIGSFLSYPQNSQSADYTIVLGDAGKQIFHPASDSLQRDYTIPSNSLVPFPLGTVVLFTVENGGRSVRVSCGDTLVLGTGTTGTVQVLPNNSLMCIKVTETKWMANYLYQAGVPSTQESLAVASAASPFFQVYPFSSAGGFGVKLPDPGTLPTGAANKVAFSPTGDAIAVAHTVTPFVTAYPFTGAGFGVKFANPGTLPAGAGNDVAFSPTGDAIAVAHATTPFISVYPWSGSGFGTRFANPVTLPAGEGNGVAFSPTGDAIAVAHATTPFISVYPWSGSGFGVKFANPGTLPASTGESVSFNAAGDAIAIAHITTPFISVYRWSGSGFGVRFANPATLPTANGSGAAFTLNP